MSIESMVKVWNSKLPAVAKLVALCYADYSDAMGGSIFPSIATVSKKTSVGRRTVQRNVKKLQDAGILILTGRTNNGCNRYNLNFARLEAYTPTREEAQEMTDDPEIEGDATVTPPIYSGEDAQKTPQGRQSDTPPMPEGHPPRVSVTPDLPINQELTPHLTPTIFGTNKEKIWAAIKGQLWMDLGKAQFTTYIKGATVVGMDAGMGDQTACLVVAADHEEAAWIQARLQTTIDKMVRGITLGAVDHVDIIERKQP